MMIVRKIDRLQISLQTTFTLLTLCSGFSSRFSERTACTIVSYNLLAVAIAFLAIIHSII